MYDVRRGASIQRLSTHLGFLRPMALLLFVLITVACEKGEKAAEALPITASPLDGVEVQLLTYEADKLKVNVKASFNRDDLPSEAQITFFASATCDSEPLATSRIEDFQEIGSKLILPMQNRLDIYGKTNPSFGCFLVTSYTPTISDPLPPLVTSSQPVFPSRLTTQPVLFGSASPATATLRFYKDLSCTTLIGEGLAAEFGFSGIRVQIEPGIKNMIYGQTVDPLLKKSSCALIGVYQHTSGVVPVPVLSETLPSSPGGTVNPRLKGALSGSAETLKLFSDNACTMEIGSGSKDEFAQAGVVISVEENLKTSIYAEAYDSQADSSECVYLASYVHDGVKPNPPGFSSIAPVGPTNQTYNPLLKGVAPADSTFVRFYDSEKCDKMIGTGRKELFSSTGINVTVAKNQVTRIHAQTMDAVGNLSDCTFLTEFEHDSIAPENPIFSITNPITPNNKSVTPFIIGGTDESTVTVEIHNDETCSSPIAVGTREEFTTTGIQVTVTGNQATSILAVAIDLAGNRSECSFLITYDHSTRPSPDAVFVSTSPVSPTNRTTRPLIIGSVPISVQKVSIFSDAICENQLANGSRLSFITMGLQVSLSANAISPLYAITLDKYGNESSCAYLTDFIHTDMDPLAPLFVSITPTSPNRLSTAPKLKGSIQPLPGGLISATKVSVYESIACASRLGNGTVAEFEGQGITVNVPENTMSTLYVKAFDDAGNSSPCTYMTDYIHDSYLPAEPIFVSSLPASPSYTQNMMLKGTLGLSQDFLPIASMDFYSDAGCTAKIGTGSSDDFVGAGIRVTALRNTTTSIYGQSTNIVGSQSACRLMQDFLHNDLGPKNLVAQADFSGGVSLNWLADSVARPVPTYVIKRALRSGGPYTVLQPSFVGTNFNDLSVTQGQTYYYVVSAQNSTGETLPSNEASITIAAPAPVAAQMLTATGRNREIRLNWSGSPSNLNYSVFRSVSPGGPYSLLQKNITSASYVDKTVLNDQVYYYVVRALNPSGETLESNEAAAVARGLLSPSALKLSAIPWLSGCDYGAVVLHWEPPPYHDGFTIHRARSTGVTSPLGTSSSHSFTDCLWQSTDYTSGSETTYYSVDASWGSEQSGQSNAVLFYRIAPVTLNLAPGNQMMTLSWSFNNYADSADVYRATSPSGPFTLLASGLTNPSYTDSAVSNGSAYYYYVQNYLDGDLYGFPSLTMSAMPAANPSGPSNLTIAADGNLPVLSWTPPSHATTFYVYRANAAGGPYGYVDKTTSTTFRDATITAGLRFYRVTAIWGLHETAPSNTVSFRYGHPGSLTATGAASSISLSWPGVVSATGYRILRSTTSNGTFTQIGTSTNTSYTDSSAAAGVGYFYMVRASFSDSTLGGFSPVASAMRTGSNVPSGLTVTTTSTSSVSLEWARVNSATRYTVYRATAAGGPYQSIGTPTTAVYQATGLLMNTEYFFRVTATVGGSESAQSATVTTRTVAQPTTAPTGQPGDNQIRVSWTALVGANTYSVERSTDRTSFTTIASGLTTNNYVDTSAVNGTRYFYRINVIYNFGSVLSKTSDGVTPGIVPLVPAGLVAYNTGTGSDIALDWAGVALATGYKVYRSNAPTGPWVEVGQISSSNYNASGLTPNTLVYFAVKALIGTVESPLSNAVAAFPSLAPAAPDVEVTSNTSVLVTWSAVSFASNYDLQRSSDGVSFTTIASNLAGTTYTDSSLIGSQTYYYRFVPRTAEGVAGASSSVSSGVIPGVSPLTPVGVSAVVINSTTIRISWISIPNVTSYVVSRGTAPGGPYTALTTINDPTITFDDTNASPGTVYYYVVQSMNSFKKKSSYSQEIGISTDQAPTNLTASAVNLANSLTWDSVPGATGYRVFRSSFSGGPYGILTNSVATTSFSDTQINHGATYFYVVSAIFANQELSAFSNQASATAVRTMDLATAIELLDVGLYSQDASTVWNRSAVTLKPSAYDGAITSEFEIQAANSDSEARLVELINASDEVVAQISIPAGTTNLTRMTAPLTWPLSTDVLKIRTEGTTGIGLMQITNARILIKQLGATQTRLYVPLLSRTRTPTSDNNAFANVASSSSSTYQGLAMALPFKREMTSFSKLTNQNPFSLEVIPSGADSALGAFALINRSKGKAIITTETLFDGGVHAPIVVPFSDNLTDFGTSNEGDNYEIDLRCRSGCTAGGWVGLQKAGLWIELDRLEKAITYLRLSPAVDSVSTATAITDARMRIDLSDYSNPSVSMQVKGSSSGMNSSLIQLGSLGFADADPASASEVAGSSLSLSTPTPMLVRSGPLTIATGERFAPLIAPGDGAAVSASSVILLIGVSN